MKTRRRGVAVALLLVLQLTHVVAGGGSSNKCTTGSSYSCPNCGGIEVEDCFDCIGYVSTDTTHNMCIDRKLFQKHNEDTTDHESHYHYLWQDIVGAIVWFVMAGVATACGVGGGGIYVPLGILLLQFSPKQSSGLSQASIFGASLGGLILNARHRHPCKKIRCDPGVVVVTKGATSKTKQGEGDSEDGRKTNVCSDFNSTSEGGSEDRSEPELKISKETLTVDDDVAKENSQEHGETDVNDNNNVETSAMKEEEEGACDTGEKLRRAFQVDQTREYEEQYVANGNKFYTRPLINYDMALFLAPMEMAGAVLGVLIQRVLPNWLYLAISGVVLSFTAYKTYKKFFAVRKKEKVQEQEARDKKEASEAKNASCDIELAVSGSEREGDRNVALLETGSKALQNTGDSIASVGEEQPQSKEQQELIIRKQYLEDDMRQYPREKIMALVILWVGLFVLTLLKGGKGVQSLVGITCESPWYSVLIGLQFVWLFSFALWFGWKLVNKQDARDKVHYPYLDDDPNWDRRALRFYGSFTFVAGIVAGLIGIGGGMVLGPLMLIMGIHPRVSSATTATMIVLTSSSVAVIFVTSGLVPWSYAVFLFFVCLAGAIFGKRRIDKYVKRTGRASLLIFILASIILFATIGVLVIMFTRLAEKDWCLDGFNVFCQVDSTESCPASRLLKSLLAEGSIVADFGAS